MILAVLLWAGCSGPPADDPTTPDVTPGAEPSAVPGVEPEEPSSSGPAAVSTGNPELIIQYENVSPLYRGFFSDRAAGQALARAASTCVGDNVYLYVSYDNDARVGRLTLRVEPDVASCRPVETESGWDLSPVTPLSTALASYRDALSASYDMRISSFDVQVTFRSPSSSLCTLKAQGAHPPDGLRFADCVQHDLSLRCGETADATPTHLTLSAGDRRALRSCFTR